MNEAAPSTDFHLSYIPALDGMRGFAVLLVVLFHSKFINGGYFGVDIFFVLSGFLITSLIIREWTITDNVDLRKFYLRRVRRLSPALIAVLVAACLYETLYFPYPGVENIFIRSFYALSYFANWVWAFQPSENPLGSLNGLWSLSIEEQFYIIWPAILIFFLRRRISLTFIAILLLLTLTAAVGHRYLLWEAGAHSFRLYAGTDSHADPILIGCLIGVLARGVSLRTWELIRPWLAATVPFVMIALVTITVGFSFPSESIFYSTIVALLSGILILCVTVAPAKVALAAFGCPFMIWLGKISYGLYLWHGISNQYLMTHNIMEFRAGRIAIGLILAVGSYYFIERPFLRNKLGCGELDGKALATHGQLRPAGEIIVS